MTPDPLRARLERILAHQYEGGYGDEEMRHDLRALLADAQIEALQATGDGDQDAIRARWGVGEKP